MNKILLICMLANPIVNNAFGENSEEIEFVVDTKIVNGENAQITPYQISIRTKSNFHVCGGSVISNLWILTAAHCVAPTNYYIVTGTIYINNEGSKYEIASQIRHPNFNEVTLNSDIALIKTKTKISYNANVQPIKLPSYNMNRIGEIMMVTGWGSSSIGGGALSRLQKLYTYAFSWNLCKKKYSEENRMIFDTMLCAYSGQSKVTCFGDSGGPLVYNNELHGVVCSGKPCGVNFPDIYTRVYSFLSWINSYVTH